MFTTLNFFNIIFQIYFSCYKINIIKIKFQIIFFILYINVSDQPLADQQHSDCLTHIIIELEDWNKHRDMRIEDANGFKKYQMNRKSLLV